MPSAARVAANARSHSPSGTTSVSSGPSSARRSRTSSSALRHELGVLAKPEAILSSWKHTRSKGSVTALPARPISI
jgi:hypothetical protein